MLKRLLAVLALIWLLERGYGQMAAPVAGDSARSAVAAEGFAATVRGGLLRLDFAAPVQVESIGIFDMHGRHRFTYRPSRSFSTLGWIWDGRDSRGELLARGRYHVRVQTGSGAMSRAVEWNPAP